MFVEVLSKHWNRALLNDGQEWVSTNYSNSIGIVVEDLIVWENRFGMVSSWAKANIGCIVYNDISGVAGTVRRLFLHEVDKFTDQERIDEQHQGM